MNPGYRAQDQLNSRRKWPQVIGPKTNSIEREMNLGCQAQDQLNTSEPTAP